MNFRELEAESVLERVPVDPVDIGSRLGVAHRDVAQAGAADLTPDWRLAIAYNAMIQSGQALMRAYGYRARGADRHRTVVRFLAEALPDMAHDVATLDRTRRQRNRAVYDMAGEVSDLESHAAVARAQVWVLAIEREVVHRLHDSGA